MLQKSRNKINEKFIQTKATPSNPKGRVKGVLLPRMHLCVPRSTAIRTRPRTYNATSEYSLSHFFAKSTVSHFRNFFPSTPSTPSVVTTKGVKCLLLSRHACRYLFFFCFSCSFSSLSSGFFTYDFESA